LIPVTAQDFRDRAAECQRLADRAQHANARGPLLYVASRWRAMADADEQQRKPTIPQSDTSPSPME
jgi:hypothetical protein